MNVQFMHKRLTAAVVAAIAAIIFAAAAAENDNKEYNDPAAVSATKHVVTHTN